MNIQPCDRFTVLLKEVRLGDPHVNSDDRNNLSILFSMYEPLVIYGEGGNYLPWLAESWTLDEDARTWTFKLRQQVKFHDGSYLGAKDVLASLDRVMDPNMGGELGTHSLYRSYLGDARFEALDEYTVQIITGEPLADLLDLMVKFPIVPAEALGGLPGKPVGSGPYRFSRMEPGIIFLEAFNEYWRGTPPIRELIWVAQPDGDYRVASLLRGKADLIADVHPDDYDRIQSDSRATLYKAPSSVCTIFMCNVQKGVCQDKRVRQALNYALDKKDMINTIMQGYATPLNGPLANMHLGYDPETEPYPFDINKAKTLLVEAGFEKGMKFVLDVPSTLPDEAVAVAHVMKAQYSRVGIDTEIKVFTDRPAYANMVRDKQIDDACAFDSSPLSTYQVFVDKFHSGLHGAWWQGYSNPVVDQKIDRARTTVDVSVRQRIYREAYRILRDDAPWIYLFNATLLWGVGQKGKGWKPSVDGIIRLGP